MLLLVLALVLHPNPTPRAGELGAFYFDVMNESQVWVDLSPRVLAATHGCGGTRFEKARASDRCQLRIDQSELGADHLVVSKRGAGFPKWGHG